MAGFLLTLSLAWVLSEMLAAPQRVITKWGVNSENGLHSTVRTGDIALAKKRSILKKNTSDV